MIEHVTANLSSPIALDMIPRGPRTALAPTRTRQHRISKTANNKWTAEEDTLLTDYMSNNPEPNWKDIECMFPQKTQHQVFDRWEKVLNPKLVKGSWTLEEDQKIIHWVQEFGPKNWGALAEQLPGRISKQCRERWHNHLCPDVSKQDWSPEEDKILIELQSKLGNKWAKIAAELPGRTDNAVKNRWNSSLKRRLARIEAGQQPQLKRGRKTKRPSSPSAIQSDDIPKPQFDADIDMHEIETISPITLESPAQSMHSFSPLNQSESKWLNGLTTASIDETLWSPPGQQTIFSPFGTTDNLASTLADVSEVSGPKYD